MLQALLLPSCFIVLLLAINIQASSSQQQQSSDEIDTSSSTSDRCTDLNFQAAALQGGDSCKLINAIIDDGDDLFAADSSDIEATCGSATLRDNTMQNNSYCVDAVVDVVSGIAKEGCDGITGG